MSLDPTASPGSNFPALANFKLTLPDGSEVSSARLVAGFTRPGIFFTDPMSGGMSFRCPTKAGTTPNSKYSRCELREMRKPDGSADDPANNWTCDDGGTMRARLSVDHVSTTGDADKVGRVIIGQIHGPESEPIRLYYRKTPGAASGRVYAAHDDSDNNPLPQTPDIVNAQHGGIALGEKFGYTIRLFGLRLVVYVRVRGQFLKHIHVIDEGYRGQALYFKCGNYNQQNTGADDDYARVTVYQLAVSHP